MDKLVKVGMADLNTAKVPQTIRTSGLGSCIGVVVYDERLKLSAMAHIMLPDSTYARSGVINRAKYADTAVADLIGLLEADGALRSRLKAKIAGGAQMFQFSSSNEAMRIGPRNAEAVKDVLASFRVELVHEDTGGGSGRTIEFNPATSVLNIRTVNKGVVEV
ncbi:chemotaxis protein CheD [Salisediminibacterium halotolerans]|nr:MULTISPECIES: chemotaxis protein CheD [Salisediminibacterium]RPE87711.1 chemotaxis protein CheD [Salisediminibacterium halotolerans]GEL06680.1 chemoreceptor glutamine deamidase CheD [Salisediminibacterium halotolerans]